MNFTIDPIDILNALRSRSIKEIDCDPPFGDEVLDDLLKESVFAVKYDEDRVVVADTTTGDVISVLRKGYVEEQVTTLLVEVKDGVPLYWTPWEWEGADAAEMLGLL